MRMAGANPKAQWPLPPIPPLFRSSALAGSYLERSPMGEKKNLSTAILILLEILRPDEEFKIIIKACILYAIPSN